jgi:hypothetical protein
MVPFRGSLSHYRLQLLVPALVAPRPVSGLLRVERGEVRRELHLLEGLVVGLRSSHPGEHLGQVLADHHLLTAREAAACFEAAEAAGQTLGSFLLSERRISPAQLAQVMAFRTRLVLLDAYTWESGEVELVPGAPTLPRGSVVPLPLASLHRDTVAALEDWRRFRRAFPHLSHAVQVRRPTGGQSAGPQPPGVAALLALAEQRAPVSQLLAVQGMAPEQGARRLLGLLESGHLLPGAPGRRPESASVGALVAEARAHLARGDAEEAARLAEVALASGPVPEADALYREAAACEARALESWLQRTLARLKVGCAPDPVPPELTTDDLYVLSRLKSAPSPAEGVQALPMGRLAAARALRRLEAAGVVAVDGPLEA